MRRFGIPTIPEGCQQLAGGGATRHPRYPFPRNPDPGGVTARLRYDPAGVGPSILSAFRWCRCAQPPANGWDPFGVVGHHSAAAILQGRQPFTNGHHPGGMPAISRWSSNATPPVLGNSFLSPSFATSSGCGRGWLRGSVSERCFLADHSRSLHSLNFHVVDCSECDGMSGCELRSRLAIGRSVRGRVRGSGKLAACRYGVLKLVTESRPCCLAQDLSAYYMLVRLSYC